MWALSVRLWSLEARHKGQLVNMSFINPTELIRPKSSTPNPKSSILKASILGPKPLLQNPRGIDIGDIEQLVPDVLRAAMRTLLGNGEDAELAEADGGGGGFLNPEP